MKEVKIKITGSVVGIDYNPWDVNDENIEHELQYWWETWGFQTISSLTANGEDIQKKKGKYVKQDYFRDSFRKQMDDMYGEDEEKNWDGGMFLYFKYWHDEYESWGDDCETYFEYTIKLEDDEEFDPKQLQLIRSEELYQKYRPFDIKEQGDYDSIPPYYIVADCILYKGEEIWADDPWDISPLSKMYYECKIEVREKDKEIPTMYPSK